MENIVDNFEQLKTMTFLVLRFRKIINNAWRIRTFNLQSDTFFHGNNEPDVPSRNMGICYWAARERLAAVKGKQKRDFFNISVRVSVRV